MRCRTRRLQIGKALAGIGPVRFPQRFARRRQAQMRTHRSWNRIGNIGPQIFQRPPDNAPEPPRRKFALASRFVDRNNPSDFERRSRFLFGLVGAALFVNVAENLELRLHDLQFTVASLFDLAVERHHLPRLKAVLKISGVKPYTLQTTAALADRKLEDGHSPRAKQ